MKKKLFFPIIVAILSVALLTPSLIGVANAAYIFSDGFESGNLNAWTVTYGALSINSQIVNSGAYSVQSIEVGKTSGNLYYQYLGSSLPNPLYLREYVYINSTTVPSTNGDYYEVGGFSTAQGGNFGDGEICVFNVAGTLYWGLYYPDASSSNGFSHVISTANTTATGHPVSIGWTCVELKESTGTSGEVQLFVNGVSIIDKIVNNNARTPANVVISGSGAFTVAKSTDSWNFYIDDVIVSGSYIGPFVQLTTSTNYGTVSPLSGPQNMGSNITITATPPTAVQGERYVFQGWTGTGIGSYSGLDNPASFIITDNITETASWSLQYYLNVTSLYGSPSPLSGWYNSGSSITASVATPVSGASGTQYVSTGWSGSGSVPASGSASAVTFTLNSPSNITWNWQTQYYLTTNSPYGTAGGAGWYNSGVSAYPSVTPLTVNGTTGTQYVFTNWSGDASGTTSPSNAIIMNASKTALANWQTQYYLNVSSTHGTAGGTGWYNSGTFANATTPLVVAGATGTQYLFTGWSGDASGYTSPSNNITMNAPKTAIANWKTQYNLTFTQSGVGSDFSGAVATVNGTSYDRAGFATWANSSDVYTFSYVPQLVVAANSKQCLLTGVSGNNSALSFTILQSTAITGTYKTQYYLTTTSDFASPSPVNGWYDSGLSISAFVASPVSGSSGTQYVCSGWSGTGSAPASGSASAMTFTISAPSTIAWTWKTQYLVTFAVSPSGTGTTSPSGTNSWQDAGSISISGSPSYNYRFSSWTTDTGSISIGNSGASSTTATITGPGNITANFAPIPTPTPTPVPIHTPTNTPTPSPTPTATSTPKPTISSPTPTSSQSTQNLATNPYIYGIIIAIVVIAGVIAAIITIKKRKK